MKVCCLLDFDWCLYNGGNWVIVEYYRYPVQSLISKCNALLTWVTAVFHLVVLGKPWENYLVFSLTFVVYSSMIFTCHLIFFAFASTFVCCENALRTVCFSESTSLYLFHFRSVGLACFPCAGCLQSPSSMAVSQLSPTSGPTEWSYGKYSPSASSRTMDTAMKRYTKLN